MSAGCGPSAGGPNPQEHAPASQQLQRAVISPQPLVISQRLEGGGEFPCRPPVLITRCIPSSANILAVFRMPLPGRWLTLQLRGHAHGEALRTQQGNLRARRPWHADCRRRPDPGGRRSCRLSAAAATKTAAGASAAASAVVVAAATPLALRLLGWRRQPPPGLRQAPAAALVLAVLGPSWPDALRRPLLSSPSRVRAAAAAAAPHGRHLAARRRLPFCRNDGTQRLDAQGV
eukprot:354316-Chlamydomonas_euryale.AAC.3